VHENQRELYRDIIPTLDSYSKMEAALRGSQGSSHEVYSVLERAWILSWRYSAVMAS
jgi:hypothetical protein